MNLLCLLKNSEVKRINITAELQEDIKNYIKEKIDSFISAEKIPFSGEYKPDIGQVLYIETFEDTYYLKIKKEDIISCEILTGEDIDNIKSIIFYFDDYIAYQYFDSRKIIKPSKFSIIYNGNTFSKIENKGLTIDQKVDVLYIIKEKKLLFTSYHNASRIFSNLSEYFREATDDEVEKFCLNNLFNTSKQLSRDYFNTKLRKKIFQIMKNKVLEKVDFDKICKYAIEIGLPENMFDTHSKKIDLPNDKKKLEDINKFSK